MTICYLSRLSIKHIEVLERLYCIMLVIISTKMLLVLILLLVVVLIPSCHPRTDGLDTNNKDIDDRRALFVAAVKCRPQSLREVTAAKSATKAEPP